ncbi:MAG TPA: hypothetical protein VGM94_13380 [Galbitalea sp.]|jgi:hypothetical protein
MPSENWQYPEALYVPERLIVDTYSVSFRIAVDVTIGHSCRGTIVAHPTAFGRQVLALDGDHLVLGYDVANEKSHHYMAAVRPKPGRHEICLDFTRDHAGDYFAVYGPVRIYVDDRQVAKEELRSRPRDSLLPRRDRLHADTFDEFMKDPSELPPLVGGEVHSVYIRLDDDAAS